MSQYWRWIKLYMPNGKQAHGLGLAAICWAIWKARSKAYFEKKLIKHPAEILCHACSFMNFWTGLIKTDFQAQVTDVVKVLLAMARRILAAQHRVVPAPAKLPPPEEDESQEADD